MRVPEYELRIDGIVAASMPPVHEIYGATRRLPDGERIA